MPEPTFFTTLPTTLDALLTEQQLHEAAEHLCQPWADSIPVLLVDGDLTMVFERGGPVLTVCLDRAEGPYRGLDDILYSLQFVGTASVGTGQLMQGSGVTSPHNKDKVSPERFGRIKAAMDKLMGAIDTVLRGRGEAEYTPVPMPNVPTEMPSNVLMFDRAKLKEADTREPVLERVGQHLLTGDGISDGDVTWVWDREQRVMFLYVHQISRDPARPFMSMAWNDGDSTLGFSSVAHELMLARLAWVSMFVTVTNGFLRAAIEAEAAGA